jgi:AcrR family transcriptional regulator
MSKSDGKAATIARRARRLELGAIQRERTRDLMIDAAARLFALQSPDATAIDDVIREAGVARGTFYNHFPDMAAVQAGVAVKLSEEFHEAIRVAYRNVSDPAERIAIGIRHWLTRSLEEPRWGWVLVRMAQQHSLRSILREACLPDVSEGRSLGRFTAPSDEIAVDLFIGTGQAAVQTGLERKMGSEYGRQAALTVLMGLGLGHADAQEVVSRPLPTLQLPSDRPK